MLKQDDYVDNVLGVAILATFLYFYFAKIRALDFNSILFFLYHAIAVEFYLYIRRVLGATLKKRENKNLILVSSVISYLVSFLFISLVILHMMPAVIAMIFVMIVMIANGFGFKEFYGSVMKSAVFGVSPWLLLEIVLYYLEKLKQSLLMSVIFTIVFWVIISVAMTWTDNNYGLYIGLNKENSKIVIRILAYIPFVLLLIVMCRTGI